MDICKEFKRKVQDLDLHSFEEVLTPEELFTGEIELWQPQIYINVAKGLKDHYSLDTEECAELFEKKNQDYGPMNIAEADLLGVIVRAADKVNRLKHLVTKQGGEANYESLKDNRIDLFNYMIIASLLCERKWVGIKANSSFKTALVEVARRQNGG